MGRIGIIVNETAGTAAKAKVEGKMYTTAQSTAAGTATADGAYTAGAKTALVLGTTDATDVQQLAAIAAVETAKAAVVTARTAFNSAPTDVTKLALLRDAEIALADKEATLAAISDVAAVAAVAKKSDTTVDTRVQFDVKGSASADNGLTFGGWIRMRSTSGSTTLNGGQVKMGYGDMTVYGGNIPGPLESMPHAYSNTVGYTGGTFQATVNQADTMAYSNTGAGANAIQVNYSMGAVSVAAAHQPSTDNNQATITYSANGLTVALGGQFSNRAAEDETVVSIGYGMGNFSFNASTSDNNGTSKTSFGASVNAGNGLTMKAYVTEKEKEANNAYGLGLSYDLGGATFGLGYETPHDKSDFINAGISFSF